VILSRSCVISSSSPVRSTTTTVAAPESEMPQELADVSILSLAETDPQAIQKVLERSGIPPCWFRLSGIGGNMGWRSDRDSRVVARPAHRC